MRKRTMSLLGIRPCVTIAIVASVFLLPLAVRAEEFIEFKGLPIVKTTADGTSGAKTLNSHEQIEFRLIITKRDGRYWWETRENKELRKVQSGEYTYYMSDAAGFVKVASPTAKRAAALIGTLGNPEYDYLETISQGLVTITYFGKRAE